LNRTIFSLLSIGFGASTLGACTSSGSTVPPLVAPIPAPSTPAPLLVSHEVDAGKGPAPASRTAVEPKCPPGEPIAFFVCAPPKREEPKGELEAPFDACAEKRGGKPFSPHETTERRAKDGATCCYLDRCQISYGY